MKSNSKFETFFPFEGKYHFGHFNEKGYKIVSDEIKKLIIDNNLNLNQSFFVELFAHIY